MKNAADDLPPEGSPEEQNALRSITDIGPRYAEALHQIGVHTPTDLASYTPESLALELREKAGVRVTPDRIRIKDWIGQAQRLIENQQAAEAEPAESETPLPEALAAQPEVETAARDNPGPEETEWRERGMFTIRIMEGNDPQGRQVWQIRVYNEGGTGPEMPFNGLDPNAWVQWIFEQMRLPGSVKPVVPLQHVELNEAPDMVGEGSSLEPALPNSFTPEGSMLEMEDVGVAFEAVDVNAWPPAPEHRLEVEASFRFEGEHVLELAQERTPFLVEFYLIDLNSQASSQVISVRGQMEPVRDIYEARQNFAMPTPGQYELQTILILPNQNTRAFRDGPTFQVVTENPAGSG